MRLLKLSLVLLVVALAGCNGKQVPAPTPKREADKRIRNRLNERIRNRLNERIRRVDFNDIELSNVIQYFRDVSGVNIYVNRNALTHAVTRSRMAVTLHQADIPLGTALALSLDDAFGAGNATYAVANGMVVVTTHEDAPALAEYLRCRPKGTGSKADQLALNRLNAIIRELNLDDIEMKDVIQFLREVGEVGIYVRWNRLNTVGVTHNTTVNLSLQDITLHTGLALCLTDTAGTGKAAYSLADGMLLISTPDDATRLARVINAGPPAGKTKADKLVAKRLNERIRKMNFDDIQLQDIIQFLRDVSGVSSYVEWSRLTSVGATRFTPVNVHLENVTLHTALILCLAEATGRNAVGYIVKDGFIHISTPKGLKELREGAAQP